MVGEYVDANGERRYVSGKTKAEVRTKLRILLADRDQSLAYDSENLSVSGYLDRWLDAVKGSVRHHTWQRHEEVVRLHLKPTIGGVRLNRLNALQVQAVYGQKLEGGLSPRSVQLIHVTLHKPLKQAVGWTLIPRNVLEAATPPRPSKREITPLSQEQALMLLASRTQSPSSDFILNWSLIAFTAARAAVPPRVVIAPCANQMQTVSYKGETSTFSYSSPSERAQGSSPRPIRTSKPSSRRKSANRSRSSVG